MQNDFSSKEIDKLLSVGKEAALTAGKKIREEFFKNTQLLIKEKKKNDFVTNLDVESEKIIRQIIKTFNPKARIIGEEEGDQGQDNESIIWFVDPIDGTGAFIRGNIAFVSVSVAAISNLTKEVLVGVVYNPFTDMLYTASNGETFLNSVMKLTIDKAISLRKARLLVDFSTELPAYFRKILSSADVDKIGRIVRYDGSFAQHLCLMAKGTLDGGIFWGTGRDDKGNFWDVASVILICKNAGLLVTDLQGKDMTYATKQYDQIIVAHPDLHKEIMDWVQEIYFLSMQNLTDLESELLTYLKAVNRSVQYRHVKSKFPNVAMSQIHDSLSKLKEKKLISMSKSWIKCSIS